MESFAINKLSDIFSTCYRASCQLAQAQDRDWLESPVLTSRHVLSRSWMQQRRSLSPCHSFPKPKNASPLHTTLLLQGIISKMTSVARLLAAQHHDCTSGWQEALHGDSLLQRVVSNGSRIFEIGSAMTGIECAVPVAPRIGTVAGGEQLSQGILGRLLTWHRPVLGLWQFAWMAIHIACSRSWVVQFPVWPGSPQLPVGQLQGSYFPKSGP